MDNREFFLMFELNILIIFLINDNNKLFILLFWYMYVIRFIICNISVGVGIIFSLKNYDFIDNMLFYIWGFLMKDFEILEFFILG